MKLAEKYGLGITGRIVEAFLVSKMPVILIIASLMAGAAALLVTPREEEPQIVVTSDGCDDKFPRSFFRRSREPCNRES